MGTDRPFPRSLERASPCQLSTETLSELFDGDLPPHTHIRIALHVQCCARCATILHDFRPSGLY